MDSPDAGITPKKPPRCARTPRTGCCHFPAENSPSACRIAGINSSIRSSRRTSFSSRYCTAKSVKLQAPTSKFQRSSKRQNSMDVVSSCGLVFRISLELGAWNLELYRRYLPFTRKRFSRKSKEWERRSDAGAQTFSQLAHFFHPGRAAVIGYFLRRKFIADGDAALPDFFQFRIIDANRNKTVPLPLILAPTDEIVDGFRDLFGCPFHR